jgi:hypothetical protein
MKTPFLATFASFFLIAAGCGTSGDNGTAAPSGGGGPGTGGTQPTGGAAGSGGSQMGGTGGASTGGSGGATGGSSGTGGATGGSSGTGGATAGTGGAPPDASTGGSGGTVVIDAGGDSALAGDTYLAWYGGSSYYAKWSNGPPSDPSFFLLSVWLQSPSNATKYKQVGINFFTGLWQGPTEAQLTDLKNAGIPTICDQGGVWQAHLADKTIRAWLQPDEPDNAQANGTGGYDPCIPPATIISGYDTMKKNDPTRPVYLGLGRGVAVTQWVGRGTCTGKTDMYPEYCKGGDIVGFDVYPANDGIAIETVASGLDNLITWSGKTKPVIGIIEASNINNTNRPTVAQIKSEVWMDIVHGAAGIEYFCHRFTPTFSETDCLDDAPTAAALKAINAQITALSPVLNSPPVSNGVTVQSSTATIPVDTLLKRYAGATYLFAAEMRAGSTTATFTLRGMPTTASAEVVGESRTITVNNGVFSDTFQSYGIHIYRITY